MTNATGYSNGLDTVPSNGLEPHGLDSTRFPATAWNRTKNIISESKISTGASLEPDKN